MVALGAVVCAVASVGLILALGEFIAHSSSGRPEAKRRAGELLRSVLTPDQYSQLMQRGHLDLASPSDPERVYRVPKGPGRVQVRDKGKVTMWLCLQPLERVPEADVMVMHKLMIEADEETYLRKANRFTPTHWEMRERPDLQESHHRLTVHSRQNMQKPDLVRWHSAFALVSARACRSCAGAH